MRSSRHLAAGGDLAGPDREGGPEDPRREEDDLLKERDRDTVGTHIRTVCSKRREKTNGWGMLQKKVGRYLFKN